jgi:DNA-binding HxlR family transcriptional regulator
VSRTDTSAWPCTIARAADVLGDDWILLVIRQACRGTRRFEDFQRQLGIGRSILAAKLNRLVAEGLVRRVEYQQRPVRYEYRLTDKGRDVYPILAAMAAWGDRSSSTTPAATTTCTRSWCAASARSRSTCAR